MKILPDVYKCKPFFAPVSQHCDFPETQSRIKTHPAGERLLPSADALGKVAPQIQGTLFITYVTSNQYGQKPQQCSKPT